MNAAEVVRFAEISYRQLDYWTSQGYLVPYGSDEKAANPGSGQRREYPYTQAQKARMMKCLAVLGFEVHLAEKIATFAVIGEYKLFIGHGVTLMIEPHDHKAEK